MKTKLALICILLAVVSACATEQTKANANAELMSIRKAEFEKASASANDYAICTSLTAVAIKKQSKAALLDNVEVILAKCSQKLTDYNMHMENYYFAISPNNYTEKASNATNKLQQQTRNNVIKELADN